MDSFVKWLIPIVIALVANIVGGLLNVKGPLFWIGRKCRVKWLKHKGSWPISIKSRGRQPTVVFHNSYNAYAVEVEVLISVREDTPRSKIDTVVLKLDSEGYEQTVVEESSVPYNATAGKRLTNAKLSNLADGKYTLHFSWRLHQRYLRKWYDSKNPPDIHASLEIEIEGELCTCDLGVISGRMVCMSFPSSRLPLL